MQIKLSTECKPQAVRLDRFKQNANDLSKSFPLSSPAGFVDFFIQSVKPYINNTTGVYTPSVENAPQDPNSTSKMIMFIILQY